MLLNSIYYGKTPIFRAYKNGCIIWDTGKYKYFNFESVNIRSAVVAHITPSALKAFQAEYNIDINHDVNMKSNFAENLRTVSDIITETNTAVTMQTPFELGCANIIFTFNVLGSVNDSANVPSNIAIDLGGDFIIQKYPSKVQVIDQNIDLQNDIDIVNLDSCPSMVEQFLDVSEDAMMHVHDSSPCISDTKMTTHFDANVDVPISQVASVNDSIDFNTNMFVNTPLAKNSVVNQDVNSITDARAESIGAEPLVVEKNVITRTENHADVAQSVCHNTTTQIEENIEAKISSSESVENFISKQLLIKLNPDVDFGEVVSGQAINIIQTEHDWKFNSEDIESLNVNQIYNIHSDAISHVSDVDVLHVDFPVHNDIDTQINIGISELVKTDEYVCGKSDSEIKPCNVELTKINAYIYEETGSKINNGEIEPLCLQRELNLKNDLDASISDANNLNLSKNVILDALPELRTANDDSACLQEEIVSKNNAEVTYYKSEMAEIKSEVISGGYFKLKNKYYYLTGFEDNIESSQDVDVCQVDSSAAIMSQENIINSDAEITNLSSVDMDYVECVKHHVDADVLMPNNVSVIVDDAININNETVLQNSDIHTLMIENGIGHSTDAILTNKAFYEMSGFETQCRTKCVATLSMKDKWGYPLKRGTSLFITQVLHADKHENKLVLT